MDRARAAADTNTHEGGDCPLCLALDRIGRPLERQYVVRPDGIHEKWRCAHCRSTFSPPHRQLSSSQT